MNKSDRTVIAARQGFLMAVTSLNRGTTQMSFSVMNGDEIQCACDVLEPRHERSVTSEE